MITFTPKTFTVPALKGISAKTIEEHIKLYEGYVKNANTVLAKVEEYVKDSETHAYVLGELMRRFSFEWNGMKNHEKYFALLEGGTVALAVGSPLENAIVSTWGSVGAFVVRFKALALTRGIGWAMLSKDSAGNLLVHWVDEQHLGQLQDTTPVIALDMWEHSFVADYQPSGKKNYVDDFFDNLNWGVAEKFFAE
jgi:Fe-Mn family superoxide dismutase